MTIVFISSLLFFMIIGLYSSRHKKSTTEDYLLAGKNVKPWMVALSAVSTNNSGYMFIGMIGYTYTYGLSSVWLMFGWIFGDFIGSLFVYKNIRIVIGRENMLSFGSVLAHRKNGYLKPVRTVAGIFSLIFLSTYAAAQFMAGGKALMVAFGWQLWIGVVLGAVLVVSYCFSGGIRASIWTDSAQSMVMIISMALLAAYAVEHAGGWDHAIARLTAVSPGYMKAFPSFKRGIGSWGPFLFVIGWIFAGYGVVGQPHVMVRYMTLNSPKNIRTVRWFYYTWFTAFYALAIMVGLLSRIVLIHKAHFDPELALPTMSIQILPNIMVGIMLSGIFAATISTADSLIISCTASVTSDIFPRLKHNYMGNKAVTMLVSLLALTFALWGNKSVFSLVIYAWAVLGTAFGPLLTMLMIGKKPGMVRTLSMMGGGVLVTLIWNMLGWNTYVYEMFPGMIAGFLLYFLLAFVDKKELQQKRIRV